MVGVDVFFAIWLNKIMAVTSNTITQKNLLILILISITMGSVFSEHAFAKKVFPVHEVVIDGPANCRDKINGKILKSIPNGVTVKALSMDESHGHWYQVSFEGTECWTSSKNVHDGLDYPSDEFIKALDKMETDTTTKFNDVKLPDGQSSANFMLEKDPCFLVKHPSDASLLEEAKRRCDKLNESKKK
jgi:hypothetical protein